MRRSLIAASAAVWLTGCTSPATRIKDKPEIFAQLGSQEQTLVRAGRIKVGFSPEAVKLALGDPDQITSDTDGRGRRDVWHYTDTEYFDGTSLGNSGSGWDGWGRYHWGADWGPRPFGPALTFSSLRVEFRENHVVSVGPDSG